ncbi:MAG: peptidoglycan DD-metalloendopeptidase family protein [Bacteroidales bacterium]|nr:peptidoglycan DD-metalloendopeptidase family protein [Bacteroidales bacterium]MDD3663805.1 peptidoglycan DD-metalloendopeptidase family protein [Bacteroidales bacterium]
MNSKLLAQTSFGFKSRCRSVLVGILLLCFAASMAQSNNDRKKLEKEQQQIEEQIRNLKKMLDATKSDHQTSVTRFQILGSTIQKRQQLIDNIDYNIRQLDREIVAIRKEVQDLSHEHEALKRDYASMIQAAYSNRQKYNWLMFIMASSDFDQAYSRLRYYQQYSEFRKRQSLEIIQTREDLSKRKVALDEVMQQRIKNKSRLTNEKTLLQNEQATQDRIVKSLASKKKTLEQDIRRKQLASEKLKKAIEKVIAEEIRQAAERARKAKSTAKTKTTKPANDAFDLTPAEKIIANGFSENRGRLPWPVEKGYIVEEYGEHPHPVTPSVRTKNNGVDILSPANAKVSVVFDGVVSRVIEVPGYHNVVIVRHGNYLSVYSNIIEVLVKNGDNLSRGDVIGMIAPDSSGKNTMVHFEIWNGTKSVNPADWLSRK